VKFLSPMLLCDFYKISHRGLYPEGMKKCYSTWTPRTSRLKGVDKVVAFGFQSFIQNYLVDFFNEHFFNRPLEEITYEYERVLKYCLGEQRVDTKHIEELHNLGYLPILIKAVPEGLRVPLRTPILTIENTDDRFFWLTNYIETLASCELWQACTSATIAYEYRQILDKAAMETVGNTDFVQFQGHDFSMRGMSSLQSAVSSGMGHLTSFVGTDTIPAIQALEHHYDANITKELVGTSISATEHSIQCAYGDDLVYFNAMLSRPGMISVVSDGYDFWNVIENILPTLKNNIMQREGKLVIRPDSGDPVKIVCGDPDGKTEIERKGAVEALWDIFGGSVTEKGYKLLDSHIGLIYGDAITLQRAEEITQKLKQKGFASINIVFGIGSYTYQYNTRDTFGFALKSTSCTIGDTEKQIFKNPKTDDGTKKSQKGRVAVFQRDNEDVEFMDGLDSTVMPSNNILKPIFKNGKISIKTSLNEIRLRLRESK